MPLTTQQIKDIEQANREGLAALRAIRSIVNGAITAQEQGADYLLTVLAQGNPLHPVTRPDGVTTTAIAACAERAEVVVDRANALAVVAAGLPALIAAANSNAQLIIDAAQGG